MLQFLFLLKVYMRSWELGIFLLDCNKYFQAYIGSNVVAMLIY